MSGKAKTHRLVVDNDSNITIIGMVSPEPLYKMALSLNKVLGLSLRNIEAVELKSAKNLSHFPRFADLDMLPERWIGLIANRCDGRLLFKKLKSTDLLMAVYDESPDDDNSVEDMILRIKDAGITTAIFRVENHLFDKRDTELITPHH